MITIYCRDHHGTHNNLCFSCGGLLDYARKRLDRCPFQEDKTTCANCGIHCYKPAMREKIKDAMRYTVPRMIHRHPVLVFFHFIDRFRKAPER
ncbi:MAG: hypothetical protein A2Y97_05895 [Nitrospirae bacterium RBG_13_39_12]|nr:MAG: hypothetical protein A2Y97_05895 [Nitrospirae bacterium RBG_13_39_12]